MEDATGALSTRARDWSTGLEDATVDCDCRLEHATGGRDWRTRLEHAAVGNDCQLEHATGARDCDSA
jgi:hypothetical protein